MDWWNVLDGVDLGVPDTLDALAALDPVDDGLEDAARHVYGTSRANARAMAVLMRVQQDAYGGIGINSFLNSENRIVKAAQERVARAGEAHQGAMRMVSNLNRRGVAAINAALGRDLGWRVERAYNAACYPDVYSDHRTAENDLEKSRRLELTGAQTTALNDLEGNYHVSYERISADMIDAQRAAEGAEMGLLQGRFPREMAEREIQMERLRFDRRELNERTRAMLRAILNAEQRRAVFARND